MNGLKSTVLLLASFLAATAIHAQTPSGAGAQTATQAASGGVVSSYLQGLGLTMLMVVAVAQGGSSSSNSGSSGTTGTR